MGAAALGFVFTKSLTMVTVFAVIFGLGYGTYLSTLTETGDAAKDMGLWSISQTLAQTIATAIAGVLLPLMVSRFGNAFSYRALFVITFVYFLIGSLLVNARATGALASVGSPTNKPLMPPICQRK